MLTDSEPVDPNIYHVSSHVVHLSNARTNTITPVLSLLFQRDPLTRVVNAIRLPLRQFHINFVNEETVLESSRMSV